MFEKDSETVKNLRYLLRNVFLFYLLRKFKIEPATHTKIDTEITAILPTKLKGFLIWKLRSDKINELFHGKHRSWLQILNKSFEDDIEIKKGQRLGFFVVELGNLKF